MSITLPFKAIKNKHDACRGNDCRNTFCGTLRKHAIKTTNFKKNKMKLLTNEQQKSYENVKMCYICKEKFEDKYAKDKKNAKLTSIVIIQVNIQVLYIANAI